MRQDVLDRAEEDPRSTPARLLDAAEEVLAENGYAGMSTREVARRAGVPFGAVHYYWGSKRGLREAALARLADRTRVTVMQNLVPGTTPGEILDHIVDAFLELLVSNRNVTRLLHREALEPETRQLVALASELTEFGGAIVREMGLDAGLDVPAAIHVISNALMSSIADEPGQKAAFGATVFGSRAARERLRAQLRRLARATFAVKE